MFCQSPSEQPNTNWLRNNNDWKEDFSLPFQSSHLQTHTNQSSVSTAILSNTDLLWLTNNTDWKRDWSAPAAYQNMNIGSPLQSSQSQMDYHVETTINKRSEESINHSADTPNQVSELPSNSSPNYDTTAVVPVSNTVLETKVTFPSIPLFEISIAQSHKNSNKKGDKPKKPNKKHRRQYKANYRYIIDTFEASYDPNYVSKPFKCPFNDCKMRSVNKESLFAHYRKHTEFALVCKYCKAKFCGSGNLTDHLRTHYKVKPYQCSVCGKQFAQQHSVKEHYRLHTKTDLIECHHCGNKFTSNSGVNHHIRNYHSGKQ